MTASDQLYKLAARTQELEDRAATMKNKGKGDLEQDVKQARESAQAKADGLSKSAAASQGKLSSWWDNTQRSWNDHVTHIRDDIDEKRAARDVKMAQRDADGAEADADFAVDYALAAIEEAEYAVLDATLARMKADELAGA
jgi:hypothetical protein